MKGLNPLSGIKGWLTIFSIMLVIVTCSTNPNQVLPPKTGDVQSAIKPDQPAKPIKILEDTNSTIKAAENRAITGDNLLDGLYERPFTSKSMVYQPDVDILNVSMSMDDNFFYFTIQLAGLAEKTQTLSGQYGIEFDLNKDGRGEELIWVKNPGRDWSTSGVVVYMDPNSDVGGKIPMTADVGFKGNGYEKKMDSSGLGSSIYARQSPTDSSTVEIAISRKQLGDPKEFLWSGWADGGIQDPLKFDYNDVFGPTQAGSPIKGKADYPLKDLFSLDNTCRAAFGFTSNGNIPGMCTSSQPKEPTTPVPGAVIFL